MNDDRLEFDALLDEIKATEQRLVELRKEYRDRKTAGLRDAIAARNEADRAIQDELKSLGYRYRTSLPSLLWRDIA